MATIDCMKARSLSQGWEREAISAKCRVGRGNYLVLLRFRLRREWLSLCLCGRSPNGRNDVSAIL
jgi:hypothetical protein